MSMGFNFLVLKSGEVVIGTRGQNRVSWAVLCSDGVTTAIHDDEVTDRRPISVPAIEIQETTTRVFKFLK